MADILFGQSYYLRFDRKLHAAMQPYPPLGTLYAAGYLRQRGYSVGLFDAMLAESEADWDQALDNHQPRYTVLFEDNFNYLSKMCLMRMRQAAFAMMRAAKRRNCTVIVSGSDASDHLQEYFDHGMDFGIIGEGEITLAELIAALTSQSIDQLSTKHEQHFQNIKGLAYSSPDGKIKQTRVRGFIQDLDALPFPAWDLVDVERYRRHWLARHHRFSMNLVTTRGCPYHCNWCAKPIYGQRYNVRSPENVVAEVKMLRDKYAPDHIEFADDIFGLKPGWISRFADLLKAEGIQIPFKCLLRADLVTDETVAGLARSGCELVWMGAESGSQKILDAMDKGTRVEQIYAATERLHQAGIEVGLFLQFGYPGEDRSDIEKTLQLVRDCAPEDIGISVSYPLPGTKFFERVKTELGEKQNWDDSADLAMMYRGSYSAEFYRVLHHVVHYEFRMRRAISQLRKRKQKRGDAHIGWALAAIPANFVRWQWTRRRLEKLWPRGSQAANVAEQAPMVGRPLV